MAKAIIIYGPPGSGKGTQAQRIAERFNLEHIETSKLIEKMIFNPALKDDPIIQRERKNFETGKLCTPEWIAGIVKKEIKRIYQTGKGILFSGSPRTLYEAKELAPFLEELYGKENILVLEIKIKPETSIFRNSHRRICQQCRFSLVYSSENEKLEKCPQCGGKLVKRILDKPETIKVRLKEYKERTEPIYRFLEKRGIKVIAIDGEPPVEDVWQDILKVLS
jgi:adenylate kinase